jgi:hypothetical protein
VIPIVNRIVARVIYAYRVLFVGGTAVLAVGTSRIASGDGNAHTWLLTIGAGCVMYAADVFGDVDGVSRQLSGRTNKPLDAARLDVVGVGLVLLGLT